MSRHVVGAARRAGAARLREQGLLAHAAEAPDEEKWFDTGELFDDEAAEAGLATAEWSECVDEKSGLKYYLNEKTGETSW